VDWAASHLANDYFVPALIALIAFGVWFSGLTPEKRRRNQWGFIFAVCGVGCASLILLLIDAFYFRPRPYVLYPQVLAQVDRLFYQPTVSSFPSYPAALTFAFAFGIWLANRKVGTILLVLAALMSLARIYVGVHYPLDILAGILIGVGATYLFSLVLQRLLHPIVNFVFFLLEKLFLA
jgi:undecaprenyl-diphosphatase